MALNLSKAYTPTSGNIANSSSYNTDIANLFNAFSSLEGQTGTLGGLTITPSANGTTKFLVNNAAGTELFSLDTTNSYMKLKATGRFYLDGGGDTYIYESSANILDIKVGGILTGQFRPSIISFTGSIDGDYALKIFNNAGNITSRGLQISCLENGAGTGYQMLSLTTPDGTVCGAITKNGTNTVLYNTTSDARVKENIIPTRFTLTDALNLRVIDYNVKGNIEDRHTGLIAQEVKLIYKEAVNIPPDPTEMMGIDYGRLTPLLVVAIQEQQSQINNLKARMEALEKV